MSVNRRSLAHPRLRGRAQACARFRSGVRGWARASERSLPRSAAGSTEGQYLLRRTCRNLQVQAAWPHRAEGPPCRAVGSRPPGPGTQCQPGPGAGGGWVGYYARLPGLAGPLPASAPCRSRHNRRRVRSGCRWSPVVPALGSVDCHLPDLWRCIQDTQVTPWGAPGRLSGEHR
jgi:hypothetical protein